jgi:2-C-methyl-D-erythritol 4-phosphate cytidylyltransferase
MIDTQIITEVISALKKQNAVTVAIPATDTIYQVENNVVRQIPDSKRLMRAQTPQAFKQQIIRKAYQLAYQNEDFTATDDCGFVAKYLPNEPIFVVSGSENNLKITHIQDVFLFENRLQNK